MKPARYDDVRAFCRVDGWERRADAPGRSIARHEVWTKALGDGTVLRTVISKGRGTYKTSTTAHILKRQLGVTEAEFWAAVRKGTPPRRPGPGPAERTGETLPLGVVRALLAAGFTTADMRSLTLAEAKRLLARR
jgi:hypothetical protein